MKAYICNICLKPIIDPYKSNMREFSIDLDYDLGYPLPTHRKEKSKIHLCGDCFDELKQIAIRRNGGLCEKQHTQENDL